MMVMWAALNSFHHLQAWKPILHMHRQNSPTPTRKCALLSHNIFTTDFYILEREKFTFLHPCQTKLSWVIVMMHHDEKISLKTFSFWKIQ